jgi:hypothetical protein
MTLTQTVLALTVALVGAGHAQTPKTVVVWAVQSGQSKTYEAAVARWN